MRAEFVEESKVRMMQSGIEQGKGLL